MKIVTLFATLAFTVALQAQTPILTSSKSSYRVGEDISIAFTNGPANAKIGLAFIRPASSPGVDPDRPFGFMWTAPKMEIPAWRKG